MGAASQKRSSPGLGSDTGSLDDWGANLAMRDWIGKAPAVSGLREGRVESPAPTPFCAIFAHFTANGRFNMSLDSSDIDKIAHLARLAIAPEQRARYATDLSNILDLVAQMDAVDTSSVEPMAHPLHMVQRLRPDVAAESNQREHFQSIAPLTEGGLYLVPKVID